MPYYTDDNTDGYTAAELAELNRRFAAAIEEQGLDLDDLDDLDDLSSDEIARIGERVLTAFDAEGGGTHTIGAEIPLDECLLYADHPLVEHPAIAYRLECSLGREHGELLWYPAIGRAGIRTNGTDHWTDALSPEDAVERLNTDTMVP